MSLSSMYSLRHVVDSAKPDDHPMKEYDLVCTGGGLRSLYATFVGTYFSKNDRVDIIRASGCSAGAIIACYGLCKCADERLISIYERERERERSMYAVDFARILLEETLPLDAHEICEGRLFISLHKISAFSIQRTVISSFTSREDLISCILASCSIPFLTIKGVASLFRGSYYVDGITPYYFKDEVREIFKINLLNIPYSLSKTACLHDDNVRLFALQGFDDFLKWYHLKHQSSVFSILRPGVIQVSRVGRLLKVFMRSLYILLGIVILRRIGRERWREIYATCAYYIVPLVQSIAK